MKLLVVDHENKKHYLNIKASSKRELAEKIGGVGFTVDGMHYHVNQVQAEQPSEATPVSMVLGGALGLFGGVSGVIIGGIIGGIVGKGADKKEAEMVSDFNEEQL